MVARVKMHGTWRVVAVLGAAVLCAGSSPAQSGHPALPGTLSGQVVDTQGGVIEGAEAVLRTGQLMPLGVRRTDQEGRFEFTGVPRGSCVLIVRAKGFGEQRLAITVSTGDSAPLRVQLDVAGLRSEVTVTAYTGAVETADLVAQGVNIIGAEKIRERALTVMGQVAQEEPGVQLLRTSPTIASIEVRGMGGNKVNLYVDGVRYTTSAMRGGISTFLNLIEPSSLDTVEVLRGPAGAQYGSDAIGGTVQFLTPAPDFSAGKTILRGNYGTLFNSADASHAEHLNLSAAGRRLALQGALAVRRASRLRTGQGIDSHSALTRLHTRGARVERRRAKSRRRACPQATDHQHARTLSRRQLPGSSPVLSMGMSDDFEIAIEEGSTMVRVGRALFGERA